MLNITGLFWHDRRRNEIKITGQNKICPVLAKKGIYDDILVCILKNAVQIYWKNYLTEKTI